MTESFSMRKIPVIQKNNYSADEIQNTDNVKILELSNFIDKWEQELLFSENGFYSLKGKNAENKTKEYIRELKELINSKISEQNFSQITSKQTAEEIKNNKIAAINEKMQNYELQQLSEWEISVYENALTCAKDRAILYKNDEKTVQNAYNNAITVLSLLAQKEKWDFKVFSIKKEEFESDFYYSIINEFIKDKDINASLYFEKYNKKINIKDKEKLKETIEKLKNNIKGYNYAKELFSYNLTDDKNEKEIKAVKNKELEEIIRKFLSDFKTDKKKRDENEKRNKNEENWQEIISQLKTDKEKAILYIDYTLDEENQKKKKNYIENIRKNGYIQTNKKEFINLLKEAYEDFNKFKDKDISDYREVLSDRDYETISELKNQNLDKYNIYKANYKYITENTSKDTQEDEEKLYNILQLIISLKNTYKEINKKEIDIETENKIIDMAIGRYQKEEKGKGESK